ncbi:hypothetical protein BDW59DRAFT_156621 [Aspergillus cavernicola]|uniref:Ser-Thr-rich glycosyl-phosphatidyl-inositol-anchored membrane family-domain-containing protein n=1 Tax=Aspergillus cavernicola TaxID=176166 RepID=A0ABR4J1B0_9EURO
MLLPLVLLLCAISTTLAQDITVYSPTRGAAVPTDNFVIAWEIDFDYDGPFTVALASTDHSDRIPLITTVYPTDGSTTLPASFLSRLGPNGLWVADFSIYTTSSDQTWGTIVPFVSVYAPLSTATISVTVTTETTRLVTSTPTYTLPDPDPDITAPTSFPTPATTSDGEDTGLSTSTKAGIGIGVSAGVLLLAAAVFFLFWRRRRNDPPKTIREISARASDSELMST